MRRTSNARSRTVAVVAAVLVTLGAAACEPTPPAPTVPPAPAGANPTSWKFFQAWKRDDRATARKLAASDAPVDQLFGTGVRGGDRYVAKSLEFSGCRSRVGAEYCGYSNGYNTILTVRQTSAPGTIIDAYAQDQGAEPAAAPFALFLAWRNGDRQRARQFGSPEAVDDLFALNPNTGIFRGVRFTRCSRVTYPSGDQDICQFEGPEGLIELSGKPGLKVTSSFSEY